MRPQPIRWLAGMVALVVMTGCPTPTLPDPGPEPFCIGIDNDRDGVTVCGADGVFHTADDDCDDRNASVFPQAVELCDGLDTNCDTVLPSAETTDEDGDGFLRCDDCDDLDAAAAPGLLEVCDGIDNDCDGVTPQSEADADGDGSRACTDCDDSDASRTPGASELCDGIDNDCDGTTSPSELADADGDGFLACDDCRDDDSTVYGGAPELCDGLDNDCDGSTSWTETSDQDGDGAPPCVDCDDNDVTFVPGSLEWCDGLDHDCDGAPHPGWLVDADGDGSPACSDCDDSDPGALGSPVRGVTTGLACEALGWAINHSLVPSFTGLQDAWESEAVAFGGAQCPVGSAATTTTPVVGPYICMVGAGFGLWTQVEEQESWSGGCATSQYLFSGSVAREGTHQSCNLWEMWELETVTFAGYEVAPPVGGPDALAVDAALA